MSTVKGRFTLRSAGVLLLLSAALETLSLDSEVLLLGATRTGAVALAYHLGYALLFAVIGVGLWTAARWGLGAVFAGAAVYTLDKGLLLLDIAALTEYLALQFARYGLDPLVDVAQASTLLAGVYLLFVLGWWLFAAYCYWRRAYFAPLPARS